MYVLCMYVCIYVYINLSINVSMYLVMIPLDFTEKGFTSVNFGMLGLGDIVLPGEYVHVTNYTITKTSFSNYCY